MMNLFHSPETVTQAQAETRQRAAFERMARQQSEHPIRNRVGARLVHLGVAMMEEPAVLDELQHELDQRIAPAA